MRRFRAKPRIDARARALEEARETWIHAPASAPMVSAMTSPVSPQQTPPTAWTWDTLVDGGDLGCGDLILELRLRFAPLVGGTRVLGRILVCTPCMKKRGIREDQPITGAQPAGGAALVEFLAAGAPPPTERKPRPKRGLRRTRRALHA
jgi:hypothetical protein